MRKIAVVGVGVALVAAVAAWLLLRPDQPRYRSVAFLTDALQEEGLACEGALSVGVFRGSTGESDAFENGSCPGFAEADQADFFVFDDRDALEEHLAESRRRSGGPGIRGVVGSHWIVSVPRESVARRVQEAVGGKLVGY